MLGRLFLAFTLIPLAELYLLIQVGGEIGVWPTIALVLTTGFTGAWLARQQGFSTMLRVRQAMAEGRMPASEMVDAMLIFGAGVVLLAPGFITDCMGILLLIPWSRNRFKGWVSRKLKAMQQQGTITVQASVIRPEDFSRPRSEPRDITPESEKRHLDS